MNQQNNASGVQASSGTGEAGDGRAWSLPGFRRFLFARAVSWLGNAVTMVALPILVFQLTGSPALTGLVTVLEALPYLLFGFPAGALADRWNRKRMLVLTGGVSGLVLATIPLAQALAAVSVAHVLIAAVLVSTLFVFFDAASFGAVPELVGRQRIASATGTMVSCNTVIVLAGPAIGGLLVGVVGAAWAIGLDAGAYLIAAALTAVIKWPQAARPTGATARSLGADIVEGLTYIWRHRVIRLLTFIGTGASISGGAVSGLLVVAGVRHLGLTDDDPRLGMLFTAMAVGAFVAGVAVSHIQRFVPTGWITIGALGFSLLAQLAWAFTRSFPLALGVLACFQSVAVLLILNGIIVRQSLAPDNLQARVNTTARMIAWGGSPIGAGIGGLIAQGANLTVALLVCSLGTGLALVLALVTKLWQVPTLAVLRAGEGDI